MANKTVALCSSQDAGWGNIRRALGASSSLKLIGEAHDARKTLELVAVLRPEVMIACLPVPDMGVHDFLSALRGLNPAIIVFSVPDDIDTMIRNTMLVLLEFRVAGSFLSDEIDTESLGSWIAATAYGCKLCGNGLVSAFARALDQRHSPEKHEQLIHSMHITHREQEILTLVGLGLTNDEIATRLTVEPTTVRTYVHSLYEKAGTRSRVKLAVPRSRVKLAVLAGDLGLM